MLGGNQNMKACAIQSFDAILMMVKKLKLVEEIKVVGVWLSLCVPIMGIL
ncbi:hypothetical protein [Helicobacter pylori]|nr:hypothetical protein [Helicobacter pylori]